MTKQFKNGHPKLIKNQNCKPTNFIDRPIKTNLLTGQKEKQTERKKNAINPRATTMAHKA
jgi:hypothetical protein